MKWKLLLAMIVIALLFAGCGASTANVQSAVIDFNGLDWQVGPDEDMTWYEAKAWADGLGGNWRMPTRAELHGLWGAGISKDNWGPFENRGFFVWSGEVRDSSSAWGFYFTFNGSGEDYDACGLSYPGWRAFAVRSR